MINYRSPKVSKMIHDRKHRVIVRNIKVKLSDFFFTMVVMLVISGLYNTAYTRLVESNTSYAKEATKQQVIPMKAESKVIEEVMASDLDTTPIEEVKNVNERVAKLKTFLLNEKSPLAPHAELIINEADKYDIGWTKLVAISAIESDFGKKIPEGSHNAWGIGGSNFMYFKSWEEGIKYASKLIGTHYKLNENQAIKAKYCPASDGCNVAWAGIVTQTTKDILAVTPN